MMDLQASIYSALYDLIMSILNPTYIYNPALPTLPTIPVIMDEQAHAAPSTGPYVSIQGAAPLSPFGAPDITGQDNTGKRGLIQVYKGTCELWEINSSGVLLQRIRDGAEKEASMQIMDLTPVSILDFGDVETIPLKIESRWIPQSRMLVEVTISAKTEETVGIIETVEIEQEAP